MRLFFLLCCCFSFSVWTQISIEKIQCDKVCGKFEKLEIKLQLDKATNQSVNNFVFRRNLQSINPFDPNKISLEAIFTAPSGKKVKRYGFYFQPYKANILYDRWEKDTTAFPWRVRFAPDEIGVWSCEVFYTVNSKDLSDSKHISIECKSSHHKGYLVIDSNIEKSSNRYLSYSEDKSPFFSVSNNISSGGFLSYKPSQNQRHLQGIENLIDAGGNFTRFDMQPQAALPDWPMIDNYSSKLDEMYAFDNIVELCENNNVYFIVFRHHVELLNSRTNPGGSDWSGVSWFDNPYRKALDLQSKKDYFSDSIAKVWQMNSLRYVFSRWGYSPNFSFYGYSEVDNWYKDLLEEEQKLDSKFSEKSALSLFSKWFVDQKQYILDSLNKNMLFSNSYSVVPKLEKRKHFDGLFSNSDIVSLHDYETIKDVNYKNRFNTLTKNSELFQKPVLLEEMGISDNKLKIYCCTGIEYHNSIWSTAMMGGIGTGMDWWWDRGVQDFGYQFDLKPLSDFFKNIPLNQLELTPQKWSDGNVDKRTIENFALVSQNKDTVLGWVHNATFYWRNLVKEMPCLQELMEKGKLTYPCFVGEGHDLNEEGLGDYNLARFEDSFTFTGGIQPIISDTIVNNPIFKVKHLKKSFGFSKNWYEVTFYEVNAKRLIEAKKETQTVSSNLNGGVKIHVPNLDQVNPDYAYKIKYIGKYRRN
ncbi:DUF5060 domain-containing protein [Crocinitomicaceae bacterium]|nr:DUF5060 domain-containing protein [Crocinitomicaceae bacterium]